MRMPPKTGSLHWQCAAGAAPDHGAAAPGSSQGGMSATLELPIEAPKRRCCSHSAHSCILLTFSRARR